MQVESVSLLHQSCEEFLAASTDITWDSTVWDDYLTSIDQWKLRPSTLTFTVPSDNPDIKQPAT